MNGAFSLSLSIWRFLLIQTGLLSLFYFDVAANLALGCSSAILSLSSMIVCLTNGGIGCGFGIGLAVG